MPGGMYTFLYVPSVLGPNLLFHLGPLGGDYKTPEKKYVKCGGV